MKYGILILLLGAALPALAENAPDEDLPNPCPTLQVCSDQQMQIWNEFKTATAPATTSHVYSGTCYVSGRSYDSSRAQHGVTLFDVVAEDMHYAGRFSFFASKNPYESWTLETARKELADIGDKKRTVVMHDSYGQIDFDPGQQTIWRYYFRADKDSQKLYVIGFWGLNHRVLCAMNQHVEPANIPWV